MDLAETVAILIARVLPASVADRLVPIAPGRQTGVDVVLVGVDTGTLGHGGLDDRLDRLLLHIGQHAQHHLPAALAQAEDRRLVLRQRSASPPSRPPAAAAPAPPCAPVEAAPSAPRRGLALVPGREIGLVEVLFAPHPQGGGLGSQAA